MGNIKKSCMGEIKMLSAEEINNLKDLNRNFGKTLNSLGDIEVKLNLIKQKETELLKEKEGLFSDYATLRSKETEITTQLLEKYGEGTIDIDSGKIELV
jgi:hypothetical protein